MHSNSVLRFWSAIVLTAIVVGSLLTRTVHGVFLHHDHAHERHACSAFQGKHSGNTHLHDQRYSIEDCPVCEFCFAVADVLPSSSFLLDELVLAESCAPHYVAVWVGKLAGAYHLRGPPQG